MPLTKKILLSLTVFLLILAPIMLQAKDGEITATSAPSADITSEGIVKDFPDLALLNFTIITEAAKAPLASTENAQKADAFVSAVKKFLHEPDTIKSTGYWITPLYTYGDRGRKPAITGFRASNGFQVKIKELSRLGELIDLATRQGVNEIQGPIWQHSNLDGLTREATVQALQKAKQMAEALAQSQGMKVKRLKKVSTGARVIPYPREMKAMAPPGAAGNVATPIEVGEQEIRATVEAVFELE
jgi:uncharacterized protein